MQEIMVKTHLIITDIHEEYHMNWCGKLIDTKPALNENGMPVFIIIGSKSRMEISTINMNYLENCAKRLTYPKAEVQFLLIRHIFILKKLTVMKSFWEF